MGRERLPRVVLDWMPKGKSRRRVIGGVKLTWKKTIENDLVDLGSSIVEARRMAVDRNEWRRFTDSSVLAVVDSPYG